MCYFTHIVWFYTQCVILPTVCYFTHCVILHSVCDFTRSVWFYAQCVILHTVCNFTHCAILHTVWNICEILLCCGDLRCFVARQFLSQIYALLSVKFSGLKICLFEKNGKYQVCVSFQKAPTIFTKLSFLIVQKTLRRLKCLESSNTSISALWIWNLSSCLSGVDIYFQLALLIKFTWIDLCSSLVLAAAVTDCNNLS